MILRCERTREARDDMWEEVEATLTAQQWRELRSASNHDKKQHLLGKQMTNKLSRPQQERIDMAMKEYLTEVERTRMDDYNMTSMTSAALPDKIEMTMLLAGQWERDSADQERRLQQSGEQN